MLIQALIRDKAGGFDLPMLADGNDREMLHIEVDSHGDQIRITFALHDLFGLDLFGLGDVQSRRVFAQDQLGTLLLPSWLRSALLKVPAVLNGIIDPDPSIPIVDLEANKRLVQIQTVQLQPLCSFVEGRMIVRSR